VSSPPSSAYTDLASTGRRKWNNDLAKDNE
jgi:hypothetical protein